ncbi:MAG TPA: hypothetical protein VGH77_29050 [Streptosporangiaceae bacterium]
MKEYGLTVLIAAAVTYLLTPLVRKFAILIGAQHEARERDVHTEPTPLLGGLAMYFGLAAGLLVASRMSPLSSIFQNTRVGVGLLLAGAVLVLMGVVDDRYGLGALTKLVGQIAAGAILVWSGAVIYWLPLPGGATLALTPDEGTVLTILLVVVTINAVNFIDGLDGLATGIVGIGAAAFYLYYYTLAKRLGLSELADTALASAVLAGVCLGFLPYNFYRARIFMGDTGSMLLGMLLAYAPISSLASIDPNTLAGPSAYSGGTVNRFPEILPLLVPATIMLIPYLDLLLAVFRRTRAGQSPFAADKKHLQHRLLAIGHSHRASVLIMYLWATLFAGTVVLLSIIRTKLPVLGVVTLAGFLVLLWLTMPRLRPWARRRVSRVAPAGVSPAPAAALANPELARPPAEAVRAGQVGPAGYHAPATYDPSGSYDAPTGYDTVAPYGAADPRTAAAAGPAGLSERDRRSAAGLSGGGRPDAGRPGERGDSLAAGYGENGQPGSGFGENGQPGSGYGESSLPGSGYGENSQPGSGQAGDGYPADGYPAEGYRVGGEAGHGFPAGSGYPAGGQAGNGFSGDSPADAGYPGDYLASPAAPGEAGPAATGDAGPAGPSWDTQAESHWDAAPESHWGSPAESRWAAPAESGWDATAEPGEPEPETEPEDTKQPPEAARPTWPGDYPEAEEPLLPWRFS